MSILQGILPCSSLWNREITSISVLSHSKTKWPVGFLKYNHTFYEKTNAQKNLMRDKNHSKLKKVYTCENSTFLHVVRCTQVVNAAITPTSSCVQLIAYYKTSTEEAKTLICVRNNNLCPGYHEAVCTVVVDVIRGIWQTFPWGFMSKTQTKINDPQSKTSGKTTLRKMFISDFKKCRYVTISNA